MKVNDLSSGAVNNLNPLQNGQDASRLAKAGKTKTEKDAKNGNMSSIYAGDLNLCKQDSIEDKRKQAQKMAMNMIMNAFTGDKNIDQEVSDRQENIQKMKDDNKECREMLNDIEKQRADIKEKYGIEDGGTEDQELELIRKSQDFNQSLNMTDEEKQHLSDIRKRGYTDYQSQMLSLDSSAKEYIGRMKENNKSIVEDNAIVRGIRIERLKSHAMDDAQDQADEIMDTANKEIVGMIMSDAKDKVDADRAENEEKAAEKKQEEKEQEAKIEAAKAKAEEAKKQSSDDEDDIIYKANELLSEIDRTAQASKVEAAQKSLNLMVGELALAADDLKGAAVDQTL